MKKVKTMTLAYPARNIAPDFAGGPSDPNYFVYRITRVTDSTEYAPGKQLLKKDVQSLCDDKSWKIIMTEFK